ncbi:MFS general substrate transporter [Russula brevipes]|nr:MFS general substrate transporter [Russula brevipes]
MPYINELVSQLPITGGDEKKVGYYAGIILVVYQVSLYFLGEASAVLQWSRLSDSIGRKPVLLSGTLGLAVTTVLFGLSRTFWTLAMSRFLAGALNGNIGVMKSMLAEMADETNIAQAFAIIPLSWALGVAAGPYVGGFLSRPHDRWPGLFSNSFWVQYPYFLPCAVTSGYAMLSLIVASILLKETLPNTKELGTLVRPNPVHHGPDVENDAEHLDDFPALQETDRQERPPTLLTKPVLLSLSTFGSLTFLEMSNWVLLPLVYTTPIRLGGLGLDPARMGVCLAVLGILKGILQLTVFHRILNFLGLRSTLIALIFGLVPSFLLFPVNGLYVRHSGTDIVLWILVLIQMLSTIGVTMAYGCTFIYISSAAPRSMLGATHGLTQTVASLLRGGGPAISASLFSFSLENNVMGGYAVFYALTLCTLAALWLARQLPPDRW